MRPCAPEHRTLLVEGVRLARVYGLDSYEGLAHTLRQLLAQPFTIHRGPYSARSWEESVEIRARGQVSMGDVLAGATGPFSDEPPSHLTLWLVVVAGLDPDPAPELAAFATLAHASFILVRAWSTYE